MLSMTGFGRSFRNFSWGAATLELSSVNHRYQEISVRLPRDLSHLETCLTSLLRSSFRRGKLRLSVEIAWNPEGRTVTLNQEALRSCYEQTRALSELLGLPAPSDLSVFLALPGVCEAPVGVGEDEEEEWHELLNEAVKALMEMRRSEGDKLREVIEKDLLCFEELLSALAERWEIASSEALEALRSRIEKVMEHYRLELDDARISQEVTLMSDRWDVSEELARLAAHLAKFRETMEKSGSIGRQLDFLLQEMNREVNTMGSKVSDASFRWSVVEAKTCLERIREQIQNVE
ncbi:MAG: YicC family protein [Fretibacterium sp.]|nr:YicC family protein [Fretibacterium sp.]